MTVLTPSSENQNRNEQRIFLEQMARLMNVIMNGLFDLKARSAINRLVAFIFLLFSAFFLISLKHHSLNEWISILQECFLYLFNQEFADNYYKGNPFVNFFWFVVEAFLNPYTLRYLPIFLIPFFVAHQAASFYLADIFELRNVQIARKFIWQVGLIGSRDSIRIREGDVLPEHFESPIYQIGGPGKVIVDLDSIVLLEKADGQTHVIGPTEKEPGGKAELEGFERVRQILDLRDHHIHLTDMDINARSVNSRSRDGIPVTATDVHLMYSIYRGENPNPTPELPYPYTHEAVEQMVYKSTSKVLLNQDYSSAYVFKGMESIISQVRGELSKFMSEKNLIEYLASISQPEIDKANKQEDGIFREALEVLSPYESEEDLEEEVKRKVPPPPAFTSRHEITDLFSQFAKKFTDDAHKKGMELQWVGIGTWKLPSDIVPEQHLEAWKLSRENIGRGQQESLDEFRQEIELQKILSLIQNIPLSAYYEIVNKYSKRDDAIKALLFEYQRLINDNIEFLMNRKKRIQPTLIAARHFFRSKIGRYIQGPPPPLPTSQREAELYKQLLNKIGFVGAIEELIKLEREFQSSASQVELLEKINQDWDLDIAGKWKP